MNHFIESPMISPAVKDIVCKNFEPTAEFLNSLRREIGDLLDLCPSDSSFETEIIQTPTRFEMTLAVNYMGGEFISRSFGDTLALAVRGGLNKIYDQIRFWRDARFIDAPWISQLAEYATRWSTLDTPKGVKRPMPRILIVDDDISQTKLLESCLNKQGCLTTVATSGKDAVEKIMSTPYDLVFLDWTMPDMNGGEALMEVEKLNSQNPSTDYQWSAMRMPIITYSGHARSSIELPPCRHFRFIDHWEKSQPYAQLISQTHQVVSNIKSGIDQVY